MKDFHSIRFLIRRKRISKILKVHSRSRWKWVRKCLSSTTT